MLTRGDLWQPLVSTRNGKKKTKNSDLGANPAAQPGGCELKKKKSRYHDFL